MSDLGLLDRLAGKFLVGDGCWPWTAATNGLGYGQVHVAGRRLLAHRVVFELLSGPIPDGRVLDHLCRVPRCVRPDHLEAVTQGENVRRGRGPAMAGARSASRTSCPADHPYDAANTRHTPDGRRVCRACHRARERSRRSG